MYKRQALGWAPPQGWQAGIEGRYLSRLYADDANDAAAPGYVVAALSAGYVKRLGEWELNAYAPVSYTHLDVYKRQSEPCCSICSSSIRWRIFSREVSFRMTSSGENGVIDKP